MLPGDQGDQPTPVAPDHQMNPIQGEHYKSYAQGYTELHWITLNYTDHIGLYVLSINIISTIVLQVVLEVRGFQGLLSHPVKIKKI